MYAYIPTIFSYTHIDFRGHVRKIYKRINFRLYQFVTPSDAAMIRNRYMYSTRIIITTTKTGATANDTVSQFILDKF